MSSFRGSDFDEDCDSSSCAFGFFSFANRDLFSAIDAQHYRAGGSVAVATYAAATATAAAVSALTICLISGKRAATRAVILETTKARPTTVVTIIVNIL